MTLRVLLTGCGSGLGRHTALRLAARGHTVVATVRRPEAAEELRAAARTGTPLHIVRMDIRDPVTVASGLAEAEELAGGLDGVVHNAGVEVAGPVETTDEDALRWQLETNVVGTYRLTRAVLPAMRRRRAGRIVFIGSLVGLAARPFASAYCASKFALEGLAESLRWELMPFGIVVSIVEPGRYPSELYRKGRAPHLPAESPYRPLADEYRAALPKLEPPGHDPDPEEVACAVAELLEAARPPLRRVVGADAEATVAMRTGRGYEEYEREMARVLGLSARWDREQT
ncbi:SDR family oxidoreductase [Streptomyces sp. NPDC054796]